MLAPVRGARRTVEISKIEIVFRILGCRKWTWFDDVAKRDQDLEAKGAPSLLMSHNWRGVAAVIMSRTVLARVRGAILDAYSGDHISTVWRSGLGRGRSERKN